MEIDVPSGSSESPAGVRENGFLLRPVSPNASGKGLPYAPAGWPDPGDIWSWKVGKRIANNGFFLDRYLYLPSRLYQQTKKIFASKLSVEQYIRKEFPGTDVDKFFALFSWKIPSKQLSATKGNDDRHIFLPMLPPEELAGHSGSDSQEGTVGCKAGNKNCSSLVEEERSSLLVAMNCNICCSESNFCRDCCCILCCKTVSSAYGGYSFIKCEAKVDEGCICAHVAHMNCALRSYMAGTVGGSIGLDAEYYCRRCDSRTQLVSHVAGLLETCKSLDSRDEIVKILNVGICILRGSQNPSAKQLLDCIELASAQLKSGADPREIWKEDGILAATPEVCHHKNDALKVTSQQSPSDFRTSSQQILSVPDHKNEGLKLEDEIDQVLQELKRSQESEYIIAEERLNAQKNYLLNLYEQLGKEKSELLRCTSGKPDALLDAVLNRQDQIKQEVTNLRVMKEVAKGFGMTSKGILKRHFGLDIKD
ncbi:uncharacterized protein LOC131151014 isoform X1 [Malania oleifera]|uniref:uncharacterized protein LOC131151014 isoform X1 n=1 Tax=Malania oleifera TaxID=397392 RepID=UPI0025ADD781|nr:uncharacterized protein LOC131151014 isoform X1 [Malania oleifera]